MMRALIDTGSKVSFITNNCNKTSDLQRDQSNIPIVRRRKHSYSNKQGNWYISWLLLVINLNLKYIPKL